MQIWKNFSESSTGQLSAVTTAINVVGCVVRLFTTASEGGGDAMFRQYLVSLALNGTLMAQILWYARRAATPIAAATKRSFKKKA
eukprot:357241-Chlamydomonas_euryale.AAC.28